MIRYTLPQNVIGGRSILDAMPKANFRVGLPRFLTIGEGIIVKSWGGERDSFDADLEALENYLEVGNRADQGIIADNIAVAASFTATASHEIAAPTNSKVAVIGLYGQLHAGDGGGADAVGSISVDKGDIAAPAAARLRETLTFSRKAFSGTTEFTWLFSEERSDASRPLKPAWMTKDYPAAAHYPDLTLGLSFTGSMTSALLDLYLIRPGSCNGALLMELYSSAVQVAVSPQLTAAEAARPGIIQTR